MSVLFASTICSFLFFIFNGLPTASCAETPGFLPAHPLFGKCTASDFSSGLTLGGRNFLQEGSFTVSDEDCMHILSEVDTLVSLAASASNVDSKNSEEASEGISGTTATEEIISRAKEVLKEGRFAYSARKKATLRRIWELLSTSVSESTIFVLGVGIELFAFSKIAKNVIAVESDGVLCQEFLKSKAGACAMKDNVHVYCRRVPEAESTFPVKKEESNAATGVGTLNVPFGSLQVSRKLIEDLVKQQFGDVPLSALVVLGKYSLAKLLLMREFLDQSTVVLSLSRMRAQGLTVLSEFMRVLVSIFDTDLSASSSVTSMFLLQPLFVPLRNDERWKNYTATEWELSGEKLPLHLINVTRKDIHLSPSFSSASIRERQALDTYLRAYSKAMSWSTDAELRSIIESLSALRISAVNRESVGTLLAAAKQFVLHLADAAADSANFQVYRKLLMDTVSKMNASDEVLIHATICEISVDAVNLIASPNIMEKLKDGIEEACELAEVKPHLLLPALRLIRESLWGEDSMDKALQLLIGLKQLPLEADVSELAELSEAY